MSKPSLILSERVAYMIRAAVHTDPTLEVGGLLKCEVTDSGSIVATDIAIPPQDVAGAHFDVKAEKFRRFIGTLAAEVATEEKQSVWNVYRGLWHSHCGMSTTPSTTDTDQLEDWVRNEGLDWFIGLVTNTKEEFTSWMLYTHKDAPPGIPAVGEAEVDVFLARQGNETLDKEVADMMKHVKRTVYRAKTPTKPPKASTNGQRNSTIGTKSGRGGGRRPLKRGQSKALGKAVAPVVADFSEGDLKEFSDLCLGAPKDITPKKQRAALAKFLRDAALDHVATLQYTCGETVQASSGTQVDCLLPFGHLRESHWHVSDDISVTEWAAPSDELRHAIWCALDDAHNGPCKSVGEALRGMGYCGANHCTLPENHGGACQPNPSLAGLVEGESTA